MKPEEPDILEIPICRVRRGPAEPMLARQLLGWVREKCLESQASGVQITDEHPGQWIESRYVAEGFLPNRWPIAVPRRRVTNLSGVGDALAASPLSARLDPRHATALSKLTPTPAAAHSVESVLARSSGRCNYVSVDLSWSAPSEDLAGSAVHLRGDEANLFDADLVQVGALGKVLAQ